MSRWKWALIAVAVVLVGVIAWRLVANREAAGAAWACAVARAAPVTMQPVPVTVVAVEQKDVPIYLSALGTVQALNTVTVNAQVIGPDQVDQLQGRPGSEGRRH